MTESNPKMSKKKPTGLSKKVPTIFEGLPKLGEASHKEPSSGSSDRPSLIETIKPFVTVKRRDMRFLFEAGESSIKAMVEKRSGDHWATFKSKRYFFEPDQENKRQKNPEALEAWIGELVSEFSGEEEFETRLLLSGKEIFITEMDKPEVSAKEFKDAVIWQIAENLPFPVEDSTVLYEARGAKVLAAAVENTSFNSVLASFHNAGVYPDLITLLPIAYEELAKKHPIFPAKNFLLLHIGGDHTRVMGFRQGEVHFVRGIAFGGDHITQAMVGTIVLENQQITIGFAEAETIKENLGMPTPQLVSDSSEPKLSQLSARVRPIFEKAVSELRSSMLQFERQFPSEKIETIYLSGGGAEMKGMDIYFFSLLNIPVKKLDRERLFPLTGAEHDLKYELSYAGLLGLKFVESTAFNFAALADRWKKRLEKIRDSFQIGSLVLTGVFALLFAVSIFEIIGGKIQLQGQMKKFHSLGPTVQKIEELDSMMKEIETRRTLIRKSIEPNPYLGAVLRELSHLVPGPMVFKAMSMAVKNFPVMDFEGTVESKTNGKPGDLVVSEFLDQLNGSPFFTHSTLESRSALEAQKGMIQFLIRTHLVAPYES